MKRGLATATAVIQILVLYQIFVKRNEQFIKQTGYKQKCYLDSCETTFIDRFGNDKKLFNHVKHKNETELSKEFHEIKKRNGTTKITWEIIKISCFYNPNSKHYLLCSNKKYDIATYKGDNLLIKRTEIINTCRHRSMYKLANCNTID